MLTQTPPTPRATGPSCWRSSWRIAIMTGDSSKWLMFRCSAFRTCTSLMCIIPLRLLDHHQRQLSHSNGLMEMGIFKKQLQNTKFYHNFSLRPIYSQIHVCNKKRQIKYFPTNKSENIDRLMTLKLIFWNNFIFSLTDQYFLMALPRTAWILCCHHRIICIEIRLNFFFFFFFPDNKWKAAKKINK